MATITVELDACNLACPLPLLKAKQCLNRMQPGEILRVTATDAGSWRDFEVYTQQSAHTLLERSQQDDVYSYLIKCG